MNSFQRKALTFLELESSSSDSALDQEVPSRKKRKYWVRPWIKSREEDDNNTIPLFDVCRKEDSEKYFQMLRMTADQFDCLLDDISDKIMKQDTVMRKSIPPKTRLEATLYFLGHGGTLSNLETVTKIPISTLSKLVPDVCRAIYSLGHKYIPSIWEYSQEDWIRLAKDFETSTGYPLCIGSLDGKHCHVKQPPNSGTLFHNYKGGNSIVLTALANSRCQFTHVEIGHAGSTSDGGQYQQSVLKEYLEDPRCTLPKGYFNLGGRAAERAKYHIVVDDAYALTTRFMKPFPFKSVMDPKDDFFNYSLSKARSTVERAFGQITSKFQILRSPMSIDIASAEYVIGAITVLHNFLSKDNLPVSDSNEAWMATWENRNNLMDLPPSYVNKEGSLAARDMRNNLKTYLKRKYQEQKALEA